MMTAADPTKPSVELEECISKAAGAPDHILERKGVCEQGDYKPLRAAGFVYTAAQPNTKPLYRCYSESEHSHFASNDEACDKMGRQEELLGYDLNR